MKNIVLITFDSLRADHCGYCGYDRDTTPNLDKLAEDGVSFTNAVSPASRTNPSMSGILTGEPLVTRGEVSNPTHSKYHLDRYGTIAEEMSANGYATGAFCPNAYSSRYYGFDRGFDTFEDFLFNEERYQKLFDKHIRESDIYTIIRNIRNLIRKEEAFRTWETYIGKMVEWVNTQDRPFFLWGFSLDTHFPYITPRNHRKWSNTWKTYYYNWRCNRLLDEYDIEMSKRDIDGITDIYDDSIRYADKLIGELQSRLNTENTVFIVCADHGEALGERGLYGHFYPSLYEENIHVPLVIGGDLDESGVISKPISLTEIPKLIKNASEGTLREYQLPNYAISTTYDGRRDRNLISAKINSWKYQYVENEGIESRDAYDLSSSKVEPDQSVDNNQVDDLLKRLVNRRKSYEDEVITVRQTVSSEASTW